MYTRDAQHSDESLQEKLSGLYRLRRDTARINLSDNPKDAEAYVTLLHRLGDPHLQLPPTVHVAGTNGKGSCIAFMKAISNTAGYKTHRYTSPHLHVFNERIYLRDDPISDDDLEALLDHVLLHCDDLPLTFFEVTTAMAFLAFSRHDADILFLETGLGGRLDCTNIVPDPVAALITHIGYDHMEFLGESLPDIAREKAGIIKKGAPCIIARQDAEIVTSVIRTHAETLDVAIIIAEPPIYKDLGLYGAHQRDNAGAAIACLRALNDFTFTDDDIKCGLTNVSWPGRLERIPHHDPHEVWFDGGHNVSTAHILAAQLKTWQDIDPKPVTLVLGMMQSKSVLDFVTPLVPCINTNIIHAVSSGDDKAFTPAEIKSVLKVQFPELSVHAHAAFSLAEILSHHTDTTRVLITGSLYLRDFL